MPDSNRFVAPRLLRNAHLQTIFNSQGPRKWRARRLARRLRTQTLLLRAADGTRLLAELDQANDPRSRLAVLLHGWEGSSQSSYLVTLATRLLEKGYDVLRVNLRDHGPSHHLNRELFNSTRSPEVASALQGYVDQLACRGIYLAGFSLGGSFALRIAADNGTELGVKTCVAVCPPIDPAHAMDALNEGFFAYEKYFFRRWHQSLARKLECFPDLDYADLLAQARSLDDLNRLFIPAHTDYDTVEEYFRAYSLVGDRLAALAQPAYLLSAEDDPIIPAADLARIDDNPNLHIEPSRHGGHCGFIENLAARSWAEDRILQLFARHP